jgi:ornithine carbamoyltransferase
MTNTVNQTTEDLKRQEEAADGIEHMSEAINTRGTVQEGIEELIGIVDTPITEATIVSSHVDQAVPDLLPEQPVKLSVFDVLMEYKRQMGIEVQEKSSNEISNLK